MEDNSEEEDTAVATDRVAAVASSISACKIYFYSPVCNKDRRSLMAMTIGMHDGEDVWETDPFSRANYETKKKFKPTAVTLRAEVSPFSPSLPVLTLAYNVLLSNSTIMSTVEESHPNPMYQRKKLL